jgi:hydrogenase maturation protein HypF
VKTARHVQIRGVVQGVGFRPFVYRLAHVTGVTGWVQNAGTGVEIHAEGASADLERFVRGLHNEAPPASRIASVEEHTVALEDFREFVIRESVKTQRPTVRVSPDLPVCSDCLHELFDPADRRYLYPYINCTNCGPRYSIIRSLPYDRARTTMAPWPMCEQCAAEYHDPLNRRFHAQPTACPACGPHYRFVDGARDMRGRTAIEEAVKLLRDGAILAIKGIGGYHLACDARSPQTVQALRERKFRKERPFALMVRDISVARTLVELNAQSEAMLQSQQRPIVLAPAKISLFGIAPDNRDLGIMLPYTPLQHILFELGAPETLVMTSANRSSEPICYEDEDALERLAGIADAFLTGEREIARRIDDSVATVAASGPVVLRHARGCAPQAVASIATRRPILCAGADLKSAVALGVDGQVFVSQHIGDLEYHSAFESFKATIRDLCDMYEVPQRDLLIVHDAHPEYFSTAHALSLPGAAHFAVQHHRAHVASVLVEREAFEEPVVGVAFDGTGYGDDGSIWGGEFFTGSLRDGLTRAASLLEAQLPGGDAAARYPVQAAAGFLIDLLDLADYAAAPFHFGKRFTDSIQLLRRNVRTFQTTSAGRLFDTVAALLGFTRPITFEAQAAIWLEHLARSCESSAAYPLPFINGKLDYRPLLAAIVADRLRGRDPAHIARGFHVALANGIVMVCDCLGLLRVVASGGVFQNALLVELLHDRLGERLWTNRAVPPNDGGICLGQAGLAV